MNSRIEDSKEQWQAKWLSLPVFADLNILFYLARYQTWPSLEQLSALKATHGDCSVTFVDSDQIVTESLYYEEIIALRGQVPTRKNNWHDLFNALIWRLYPATKRQLNQQHMQDIRAHGVRPRTARRDRITHFDECGVVLAYCDPTVGQYLSEHQWERGFIEQRHQWGQQVRAFIFGHANYEMLLNPFMGLTGKWLSVEVNSGFFALSVLQQYRQLDLQLSEKIEDENPFSKSGSLFPLPLLGVPGWYAPNEDSTFYENKDYFRPKSKRPRKD